MDTVVFDFDRVLYNTPALISYAKDRCNRILGIPPQDYIREYSAWSDYVRNPSNMVKLQLERQKEEVSWVNGFVPYLSRNLGLSDRLRSVLLNIHEHSISMPFVYKDAIELLTLFPRDGVFVYTAGGELDQHAKLSASGIYDMLPREHIEITAAKTLEAFQGVLRDWGVEPDDRIIHINDRLPELLELKGVHNQTESIWATWSWPGIETPQNLPHRIHRVDSIDACRMLLLDFKQTAEGALLHHERSY